MTEFETVIKEIPYGGVCYLICKQYDAADFDAALLHELQRVEAMGATDLRLGGGDAYFARKRQICAANRTFHYYSDFYFLQKRLKPEAGAQLRMKRVTQDNAALWAALYNEAFLTVPNAETIDELSLAQIYTAPHEAGFFMIGGEPVGFYELDFSEDVAEIATIGIVGERQGMGLGAQAMRSLENELLRRENKVAQILVASANPRALALYEARGFRRARKRSRWFRCSCADV